MNIIRGRLIFFLVTVFVSVIEAKQERGNGKQRIEPGRVEEGYGNDPSPRFTCLTATYSSKSRKNGIYNFNFGTSVYSTQTVTSRNQCVLICASDNECESAVLYKPEMVCELCSTSQTESPGEYARDRYSVYLYNIDCTQFDGEATTAAPPATTAAPPATTAAPPATTAAPPATTGAPAVTTAAPATSVAPTEFECGVYANPQPANLELVNSNTKAIRIVGGENANPNGWPWQVILLSNGGFFCGGSLIRVQAGVEVTDVVVTAAHCAVAYSVSSMSVRAGDHNRFIDEPKEQDAAVLRRVVHTSYSSNTYKNDIALLFLKTNITFQDGARPVCIPSDDVLPGEKCFATGWGTTSSGGSSPSILQEVVVPIVSHSACSSSTYYGNAVSQNEMVCAGDPFNTDSCQGDSGGPLVCDTTSSNIYYLHGVTSWGSGCASGYPGVYTRVASYANWIADNVCQYSSISC